LLEIIHILPELFRFGYLGSSVKKDEVLPAEKPQASEESIIKMNF
jgi:hypothetical protein